MISRTVAVMMAAAALGAPAAAQAVTPAGGVPGLERQACVSAASAEAAAVALYGPGTEVMRRDRVAGLETVLVHEPFIAPGTRHRMLPVRGRFCDAESGLNTAWKATGRKVGNGSALARAHARLAAAPYFDRTTVRSIRSVGGVHHIRTHALTNGVVADWVVVTDASGVRTAKWATAAFAVKPFVAQIEGLTARMGASERYVRSAGGALVAQRGLPTMQRDKQAAPAASLTYTTPDGFTIVISAGDTKQNVDPGMPTGVALIDRLRDIRDMVEENYEEFYGWGFRANWAPGKTRAVVLQANGLPAGPAKTGYVYVNGTSSAYCQACVYIADDFQVHILSHFDEALVALGFDYPAGKEREAFSNVMGHEIFHNFQNNYVKPTSTGRSTHGFYSEGTARTQETLHEYAEVSFQPDSLVIGDSNNVLFEGNDCKSSIRFGDDMGIGIASSYDDAMAAGPFADINTYAACHFWMRFYGTYGADVYPKLVTEGAPIGATVPQGQTRPASEKAVLAAEYATGRPFIEAQGAWMRGLVTGKYMKWGPLLGNGPVLDWGTLMDRWTPSTLAAGGSVTRTLANGGVMGVKVTGATRPTANADAGLFVIRDSAADATLSYPANGDLVAAPAEGESVYVFAARRKVASAPVTLTLGAP